MRRSTARAVVRFPVVKASSPKVAVGATSGVSFFIFRSELPAFTPNAHTHVRTDYPTTLLPTSSLVTPSHSALRVRKLHGAGLQANYVVFLVAGGQDLTTRNDGVCVSILGNSPFFSFYVVNCRRTCNRIHRETRLRARTNGALTGGTRRRRERAGDAGMRRRTRARAELVSPQYSSLLSSSCRQERDAARHCCFSTRTVFFSVLTIILLVRRASSARASEQGDFGAVSGGNWATTGASGRCRDATTDSSESGATVRARAELAAPQLSPL